MRMARRMVAILFTALIVVGVAAPAADATGRCWLYFDRDGEPYVAC